MTTITKNDLKKVAGCGPEYKEKFRCKVCGLWWDENDGYFCAECGVCSPPSGDENFDLFYDFMNIEPSEKK